MQKLRASFQSKSPEDKKERTYGGVSMATGENFNGSVGATTMSQFEVQAFSIAQARYSSNSRLMH